MITAPFSTSGLGASTIVAGNGSTPTILVYALVFQCSIATTLTLRAGSTALTGPMVFTTGGGFQLPLNSIGAYFVVESGADFNANLTGLTGSCAGFVLYEQV